MAEWVNVNDELPKKDGWYLAYINFEGVKHQIIDTVYFDKNNSYFNYVWSHEVHFWMPLPDPPIERR